MLARVVFQDIKTYERDRTRCYGKAKKGHLLTLTRGEQSKKASLKVEMPKQSTKENTGITQKSVGKRIPESGAQEPTLETASGSVSRVDNEK